MYLTWRMNLTTNVKLRQVGCKNAFRSYDKNYSSSGFERKAKKETTVLVG